MQRLLHTVIADECGLSIEDAKRCISDSQRCHFDVPYSRSLQECITAMQVANNVILPLPSQTRKEITNGPS